MRMIILKSARILALALTLGTSFLTGCQASRGVTAGVGNNPSGIGPGGISIILPGSGSSSSPGGDPGSPLGPVGMTPVPDGTINAPVEQPDVTKTKAMIYGHNPKDTDPTATMISVRRVSWSSNSLAAALWADMSLHQIQASIINDDGTYNITWDVVQEATWRDFPVSYNADGELQGLDDLEKDVTGPMLFFWLPPNQIPVSGDNHFGTLEEFLNLYK